MNQPTTIAHTMSPASDPPRADRYTTTAIVLHWLMALLIIGAFMVGLYMVDLKLSPTKLKIYSWHKWTGVTVFALVIVRLLWRQAHPAPELPTTMKAWEKRAAHGLHFLLYVLMLLVPISGWLMSSAKGFQTVWFGVLPLPDLLSKDEALGDLLKNVHMALTFSLAGLVVAHVGAALKHQLIERDNVLARMLPFLRKKP